MAISKLDTGQYVDINETSIKHWDIPKKRLLVILLMIFRFLQILRIAINI